MFSKSSNLKKAEQKYEKAIQLNEQGNLGLAYEEFMASLLYYTELQSWERVACCMRSVGNVCYNLGQLDECKKRWSEALAIYEKQLRNKSAAGEVSIEIGDIYYDIKEYDGAGLYYRQAISLFEEEPLGNDLNKAIANHKLGNVRYLQQRSDDAEKHYISALPVFEQFGRLDYIAKIFQFLGDIYHLIKKDLGSAKKLYSRSFDIWSQLQREDEKNELARILQTIETAEETAILMRENKVLVKQLKHLSRNSVNHEDFHNYNQQNHYNQSQPNSRRSSYNNNSSSSYQSQDDDIFSISSSESNTDYEDAIPISYKHSNVSKPLLIRDSMQPSAPPLRVDISKSSRLSKKNHLENIFTKVSEKHNLQKKIKDRKEAPSTASKIIAGVLKTSSPRRII